MLLEMGVRICPSFWYQIAFFRVLAHGLYSLPRSHPRRSRILNFTSHVARRNFLAPSLRACSQVKVSGRM